jgi:hypothetical protein
MKQKLSYLIGRHLIVQWCRNSQRASQDRLRPQRQLRAYKTYSWIKVQSGDSLWDSRIQQDVDAQLAAKGWTKVDSNGAAVSAFRSTQNQQSLETFYDGFGGGWRWRGMGGTGMSTTTTEVTKVGNVVQNRRRRYSDDLTRFFLRIRFRKEFFAWPSGSRPNACGRVTAERAQAGDRWVRWRRFIQPVFFKSYEIGGSLSGGIQ